MEITNSQTAIATEEVVVFDTSLVLFFLSMDVGYKLLAFSFETVVMMVALLAVLVVPFILERGDSGFGSWLAGRSLIAGLGLVLRCNEGPQPEEQQEGDDRHHNEAGDVLDLFLGLLTGHQPDDRRQETEAGGIDGLEQRILDLHGVR